MFDKEMFEKVCNVTCTLDELKRFNSKINEKEFDVGNCFEKYYSIDTVLKCTKLYKDKRISDGYLAYWFNAYNWIVMGGFKGETGDEDKKSVDLATILIWDICDWLDSLSFFDCEDDHLSMAIGNLRILDSIYKNRKKWEAFYSFDTDIYDDGEPINDINVLLVSKTKNVYYTLHSDICDFKEYALDEQFAQVPHIKSLINDLMAKGYKELD